MILGIVKKPFRKQTEREKKQQMLDEALNKNKQANDKLLRKLRKGTGDALHALELDFGNGGR